MLQLTRKADYGLRLVLEVAAHTGGAIRTAEVARRQQIPYQFLRKVVQSLVTAGLLASERGGRGGLLLARPADEITLLDVVRAFGPPSLNLCTVDPPRCDRRATCAVYHVWAEAQREVERVLDGARLSELVQRQAILNRESSRTGRGARSSAAEPAEIGPR